MTFNPTKGVLQITAAEASLAGAGFLYAIKKIKQANNLPLTPYKVDRAMNDAEHAMYAILHSAEHLGLDLGSTWGNEIDSTNHN